MAAHTARGGHDEPAWPLVTRTENPDGRDVFCVALIVLLNLTVAVLAAAALTGWI